MKPVLFKLGAVVFPSFTFMIMVGVLAAAWLGVRLLRQRGLPAVYGIDMAIIGILAGFVGARLAHILVEAPDYYLESPVRVFYFWQGGFVSWGAYLLVLICWYFYLKWRRQPVWAYFDIASLGYMAAIFFGRIGCLLNGCCYGKPTGFWLHLTFSNPAATAYYFHPDIPLHATQIYLMANALLIWLILFWVYKKKWRFQGELFSLSFVLYAIGRFLIEFLRGDVDRGVYFNGAISSGQLTMVVFFAAGLSMYFIFRRKEIAVPQ